MRTLARGSLQACRLFVLLGLLWGPVAFHLKSHTSRSAYSATSRWVSNEGSGSPGPGPTGGVRRDTCNSGESGIKLGDKSDGDQTGRETELDKDINHISQGQSQSRLSPSSHSGSSPRSTSTAGLTSSATQGSDWTKSNNDKTNPNRYNRDNRDNREKEGASRGVIFSSDFKSIRQRAERSRDGARSGSGSNSNSNGEGGRYSYSRRPLSGGTQDRSRGNNRGNNNNGYGDAYSRQGNNNNGGSNSGNHGGHYGGGSILMGKANRERRRERREVYRTSSGLLPPALTSPGTSFTGKGTGTGARTSTSTGTNKLVGKISKDQSQGGAPLPAVTRPHRERSLMGRTSAHLGEVFHRTLSYDHLASQVGLLLYMSLHVFTCLHELINAYYYVFYAYA